MKGPDRGGEEGCLQPAEFGQLVVERAGSLPRWGGLVSWVGHRLRVIRAVGVPGWVGGGRVEPPMVRERVKQLSEPLWRPVVRHIDTRFNRLLARLDDLDSRLERFERSSGAPPWPGRDAVEGVGPADAAWLSALHQRLDALSDDVWHSKAVNLGDRLLVGARHLGLVYLVSAPRPIGPRFIIDGEYEPETTQFVMRTVTPTSVSSMSARTSATTRA